MKNVITFVIPVRHPENAKNWSKVKSNLHATIQSISNQDSSGWRGVVVANYDSDLPEMPVGFEVKYVDFPPNAYFEKDKSNLTQVYEAVRSDKGRRILAGLLHAGEMGHVMIVDDDDFVSRRMTSFIAQNSRANGFFIQDGYIWGDGDSLLFKYDSDFSLLCGTSHIVRSDLYQLPPSMDEACEDYLKNMLGSHVFIRDHLISRRTPLSPLPFIGAAYRVGHGENHSQAGGVFGTYFFYPGFWRRPLALIRRLIKLRPLSRNIAVEFFGRRN